MTASSAPRRMPRRRGRFPLSLWTVPTLLLVPFPHAERVPLPPGGDGLAVPACRIDFEPIVDLGSFDGPGFLASTDLLAARDHRGRYYVVESYGTRIKVFDAEGRYLESLGREGGGPGEFRGISAIAVAPGDTLHVFDWSNVRWSVFGPDGRFVRDTRLEIQPSLGVARTREGRFAFTIARNGDGVFTVERYRLPALRCGA